MDENVIINALDEIKSYVEDNYNQLNDVNYTLNQILKVLKDIKNKMPE